MIGRTQSGDVRAEFEQSWSERFSQAASSKLPLISLGQSSITFVHNRLQTPRTSPVSVHFEKAAAQK